MDPAATRIATVAAVAFAMSRHFRATALFQPDETYIIFNRNPFGFDLRHIDPRQGRWTGTLKIAGTPLFAPYLLAGISLTRR